MRNTKKFHQGIFEPKNPAKYVGTYPISYRSSWELKFMNFCDSHPGIHQWASESIKIPYKHPLTGKNTIYVPDFLVQYVTRDGKNFVELVETKPLEQSEMEKAKTREAQRTVIFNRAKWMAANQFCQKNGMRFRVMTERDMFAQSANSIKG